MKARSFLSVHIENTSSKGDIYWEVLMVLVLIVISWQLHIHVDMPLLQF